MSAIPFFAGHRSFWSPRQALSRRLPHAQFIPLVFEGWQAQQVANDWVHLTFVPQLGGRLMQVTFNGHPYLFVNPVYKGKYISPAEAAGRWINYGGDKIWPLPEGNDDEQHWQGASTPLDDGPYAFTILAQGPRCAVRLEGPPDPPTGLQYTREISIGSDSPEISFHAITKNFTGHSIAWSVQSVSQYDLSDASDPTQYNHDFWAFTPLNPTPPICLATMCAMDSRTILRSAQGWPVSPELEVSGKRSLA